MFQASETSIKFLMLIVRQTLTNLNMQLKKIIFLFKFILTLFALTLVSIGYAKSENGIKKLDRIIAVVDQDVITEKELQEKINSVIGNLKNQKIEIPSESILRKQVIERLIANSIQIQLANQTGLKISDAQVDKTIERIAEKNKLNVVDFKKALEKDGTNFFKFRYCLKIVLDSFIVLSFCKHD